LGVETGTKIVEAQNNTIKNITIWDFSGKLDFLQIRNEFYKEADIILLFCDLSIKTSIDNIDYWIK
jgi:GTPase SAR1 family protein